jgi:hypothetical protein
LGAEYKSVQGRTQHHLDVNVNIGQSAKIKGMSAMTSAKAKMVEVIQGQPEDATYEEIMRELAFRRMVDRGLEDARSARTISNDEMARRIRAWAK